MSSLSDVDDDGIDLATDPDVSFELVHSSGSFSWASQMRCSTSSCMIYAPLDLWLVVSDEVD